MGRLALQVWGEWLDASWWNPWNLPQVRLWGTCLHSTMSQATGPLCWCVATSGNPGGWQGDTAEIGQKALPWENEKRIKSPLVESGEQWCPTARLASLSTHTCAQSGSAYPAEPPLSPPQSVLPTPGTWPFFYSPLVYTVFTSPVILTSKQMFCGKVYTAFTSLFLINQILP